MTRSWIDFITTRFADRRARAVALTLYYLGIQVGVFYLAAQSGFATPGFIYQGF